LKEIFQFKVLKMLKKERKINDAVIKNMLSWNHSGLHVYIGDSITPLDKNDLYMKYSVNQGRISSFVVGRPRPG